LNSKALLVELIYEVQKLSQKINSVIDYGGKMVKAHEEFMQKSTKQNGNDEILKLEPDIISLLSLPNALRKTVMALYKIGDATAEDLAKETKRLRAVESSAANQLVRMGFLRKRREGRKVLFYIE
jgi:hypothetical protein